MASRARAIEEVSVTPRRRPQYELIAEAIARQIEDRGTPVGSQLPSEPELAELFGVNHLTIRRALSVLQERGRVLRQRGRGTFVAEPASSATRSVLFVGPLHGHLAESQFAQIQLAAQAQGCRLLCLAPQSKAEPPTDSWRAKLRDHLDDADAVIVASEQYAAVEQCMARRSKPMVVIGNRSVDRSVAVAQILFDRQRAVQAIVHHLAELGHQRIGLVVMPGAAKFVRHARVHDPVDNNEFRECYLGFKAGLAMANLDPAASPLLPLPVGELERGIEQAAAQLRHDPRPSAFICDMDYRALAFYRAASELKLTIGRDVSVAGLGDTPWASSWIPPLTSVDLGHREMANLAIQMCVLPPLEKRPIFHIQPELIARESTGPPPTGSSSRVVSAAAST